MLELYNYFKQHIATDVYYGPFEIAQYEVIYKWIKLWVTFTKQVCSYSFSVIFIDTEYQDKREKILRNIVLKCLEHNHAESIKDPEKIKIWIDILKDKTKVDEMLHLVEACMEEYNDDK